MSPAPPVDRRPLLLALAAVAGPVLLASGPSAGGGSSAGTAPAGAAPAPVPTPAGSPPAAVTRAPSPGSNSRPSPGARAEPSPLSETGSGAFAAVREVVAELEARPETDWSRVDLERLRSHLADMHRFTLQAEVVERQEVDGGLRTTVRGVTPEADAAVRGAVDAHAPFLVEETGWDVSVEETDRGVVLEATAGDEADARKIRGLGYIGLMATGSHHTEHHWAIATGGMPNGTGGDEGGHRRHGHGG